MIQITKSAKREQDRPLRIYVMELSIDDANINSSVEKLPVLG
jgi:hypothetical protein